MSSKNSSLQLSPPQPEELVLEIAPQNGQTSPVFSVTKGPDEAARIVGNATFYGDVQ